MFTDLHFHRCSRWEELLRVMDWIRDECERLHPDVIVNGGDMLDVLARKPDVEEIRVLALWLADLAAIAPVVGVAGNHDPSGLGMFNLVEAPHPIFIADRPCLHVAAGIEFALLPWPRKGQLLAQLGVGGEQARQVGVELLTNVIRGLGASYEFDGPRCFVGHVQLRGARVSTGQPLAPGADFEIGTEDLALANCDAYLLGHVHLPDDFGVGGAPGAYGGSSRRTAYGEVEEKSLVVVDFEEGVPVKLWRVPIPCQPMILIEDEWGGELGWRSGMDPSDDEVVGADIRFRFRFEADQRDVVMSAAEQNRQELLRRGAAVVKLEPEIIVQSAARAPEVATARTLKDKIAAYWRAKDAVPPEARRERLLSKVLDVETEVASAI
jgi:exonuclease SbcD